MCIRDSHALAGANGEEPRNGEARRSHPCASPSRSLGTTAEPGVGSSVAS